MKYKCIKQYHDTERHTDIELQVNADCYYIYDIYDSQNSEKIGMISMDDVGSYMLNIELDGRKKEAECIRTEILSNYSECRRDLYQNKICELR